MNFLYIYGCHSTKWETKRSRYGMVHTFSFHSSEEMKNTKSNNETKHSKDTRLRDNSSRSLVVSVVAQTIFQFILIVIGLHFLSSIKTPTTLHSSVKCKFPFLPPKIFLANNPKNNINKKIKN